MKLEYVKRVGKEIYDNQSKPFLLKGVGIGSWIYLEGYMLKSFKDLDRQRRFEKHLDLCVGEKFREYFFLKYREYFFTKRDILLIKKHGFNSIRIPLDYAFLFNPSHLDMKLKKKPENWAFLDEIISICQAEGVYVILDLHAAPGGQTGTNIDNSEFDKPELFTNTLYQEQTIYVWECIAEHYRDNKIIACYDLLNEPLPKWFIQYQDRLKALYKRIIQAIRKKDPYHMLTLEGTVWSTNWEIFDSLWDDNIILQFHKYWSSPDKDSISEYLNKRDLLNVPIFMGEGGENNLLWYSSVFPLYEQHNISYNFWTYKKMDTENSPISFDQPENWLEFIDGKCNKLQSEKVLNQLLESIRFNNCRINENVFNHIQRKDNFIMEAYAFDDLGAEISYSYKDSSIKSIIKSHTNINISNSSKDMMEPNFKQYSGEEISSKQRLWVYLNKGEWLNYSFKLSRIGKGYISINCNGLDKVNVYFNGIRLHESNGIFVFESSDEINILKILANIEVDLLDITLAVKNSSGFSR